MHATCFSLFGLKIYSVEWYKFLFNITRYFRDSRILEGIDHGLAQVIDGALGMAYGISATSFLLSTGSSPAVASASVHIAAVFTTGLSESHT